MGRIPKRYSRFLEDYPKVGDAYESLGAAVSHAGPLAPRERALIKIGVSAGARMEGALKSHVRKAVEPGATAEEIRHAILQATTTIGFPNMMAVMSWADGVLAQDD